MAKEDDKSANAAPPTAAPKAVAAPAPNLTRDGIEITIRAKLIESGKDEAEATKLAHKRAREMIPE